MHSVQSWLRHLRKRGGGLGPAAASGRPADHAASWGLARAARAEALLPVHCIDAAVTAALKQLQDDPYVQRCNPPP